MPLIILNGCSQDDSKEDVPSLGLPESVAIGGFNNNAHTLHSFTPAIEGSDYTLDSSIVDSILNKTFDLDLLNTFLCWAKQLNFAKMNILPTCWTIFLARSVM